MRAKQCAVCIRRPKRSAGQIVVTVARTGTGRVTAVVTGDVDIVTAPHLEATLHEAIDAYRPSSLTIDIGGVAFLDATGMTALIRTYAHAEHVKIRLTNARPMVARALAITGLLEFLRVTA